MTYLEITLSYSALLIIGGLSTVSILVLIFISIKHLFKKKDSL
jgi:hypothetical protein